MTSGVSTFFFSCFFPLFLQDKPFTCFMCLIPFDSKHTAQCKPDYCRHFKHDFKLKQSKRTACSCVSALTHTHTHFKIRAGNCRPVRDAQKFSGVSLLHKVGSTCRQSEWSQACCSTSVYRPLQHALKHKYKLMIPQIHVYTYIQIKATPSDSRHWWRGEAAQQF